MTKKEAAMKKARIIYDGPEVERLREVRHELFNSFKTIDELLAHCDPIKPVHKVSKRTAKKV